MAIFWLLLAAAIVWSVAQLLPRGPDRPHEAPPDVDPYAILDARLARGEIDPDTYDELRAKLGQPRRETQEVAR